MMLFRDSHFVLKRDEKERTEVMLKRRTAGKVLKLRGEVIVKYRRIAFPALLQSMVLRDRRHAPRPF